MVDSLFDLILDGTIEDGYSQQDVQINLAKLLKISDSIAAKILDGKSRVIRESLDNATAEKYKAAIERTGAVCRIVKTRKQIEAQPTTEIASNKATPNSISDTKRKDFDLGYGSFQHASDSITNRLGIEKIEGFSLQRFFSDIFTKHSPDEVEHILSVGTPNTTPIPDASMGSMPSPWIFFRVLTGSIITYVIFLYGWNYYHNVNLIPGLIMIGSFAVPFAVLILFFELNTPKNISLIKVFQLVIVGGSISLLLSLFLFDITKFLDIFGPPFAGFVEEVGKLAALVFVMRAVNPARYRYRLNALLLGAAIGAGFAAFESAGYALRFLLLEHTITSYLSSKINTGLVTSVIQTRGMLSPFSHVVWTAIAASALWIARPHHNDLLSTVRSLQFLKLFAVPIVLHFSWNLDFDGPFYLKFIVLGFIAWVVVISLVQSGLKEIAAIADGTDKKDQATIQT